MQTVYIILPGRQPLPFYLCSNSYTQAIDSQPFKSNIVIVVTLVISLAIHILVQLKVLIHKAKDSSVQPSGIPKSNRGQNFESWNLTSFIASICCLLSTGLFLFTVFLFNRLEPSKFNEVKILRTIKPSKAEGISIVYLYFLLSTRSID